MKIYEKPMAMIEAIEVEDVITASTLDQNADMLAAMKEAANLTGADDSVILFQW